MTKIINKIDVVISSKEELPKEELCRSIKEYVEKLVLAQAESVIVLDAGTRIFETPE